MVQILSDMSSIKEFHEEDPPADAANRRQPTLGSIVGSMLCNYRLQHDQNVFVTTNWHPLHGKPWKSIANIMVGEGVTVNVWRHLVTAAVVFGQGLRVSGIDGCPAS